MTPVTVSATEAKLQFGSTMNKVKEGTPVIIEKNNQPEIVWISIDDYEDFLEAKDKKFQKNLEKARREMKKGGYGTLDKLYTLHRESLVREAH